MKLKTLFASGLCIAFTFPLLAQKENKYRDSIYINPFAGCKITLVGKGIQQLLQENNLEVLKNKFIQDYRESAKDKDFPAQAKSIIYLASQDGRRRLKAIPDDATPVNIPSEIKNFKLNLPPFHYIIYDLMKDYEYHIYVKSAEDLGKLSDIDCSKLIKNIGNKPDKFSLKASDAYEIIPADTGYIIRRITARKPDLLSIEASFGMGLINSSFTPTIGADFAFKKVDKYGRRNYEIGTSFNFYVLSNFENKIFTNIYPISSSSLYFLKNYGNKALGLSVGKFWTDRIFGSARTGSLDKAWQAGIRSEAGNFGLEYNFIFDKQKNTNTSLTFRYYF